MIALPVARLLPSDLCIPLVRIQVVRRFLPLVAAIGTALITISARADGGGRAEDAAVGFGRVWTTTPNGIVGVGLASGRLAKRPIGATNAFTIAAGEGTLWQLRPMLLIAVDPRSGRVRRRIPLAHPASAIAIGLGAAWLISFRDSTLTRIDARTGKTHFEKPVADGPEGVAVGRHSVWVASTGPWHNGDGGVLVPNGPGVLTALDPTNGRVQTRVAVDRGPTAVAAGQGSVWVLNGRGIGAADTVDRVDLQSNEVAASIRIPHWSADIAVGRRYIWVVSEPRSAGGTITRIDPATNRARTRPIRESWVPAAVVAVGGRVWVADPGVAQLIEIDPRTLRVARRVSLPID